MLPLTNSCTTGQSRRRTLTSSNHHNKSKMSSYHEQGRIHDDHDQRHDRNLTVSASPSKNTSPRGSSTNNSNVNSSSTTPVFLSSPLSPTARRRRRRPVNASSNNNNNNNNTDNRKWKKVEERLFTGIEIHHRHDHQHNSPYHRQYQHPSRPQQRQQPPNHHHHHHHEQSSPDHKNNNNSSNNYFSSDDDDNSIDGIGHKACWPYNYFASTTSVDDKGQTSNNNNNNADQDISAQQQPQQQQQQYQQQQRKDVVGRHPVDLDDSYPSDEEDNDQDYELDDLDSLDELDSQQPEMFIEVTEDQFCRTVGKDGRDGKDTSWRRIRRKGDKKKKRRSKTDDKTKNSVSRKLGHMLTPLKKKIGQSLTRESNDKNDEAEVQKGLTPLLMNSPERSSALPKKQSSPSRINPTGGSRIRFRDDADGNDGTNNNSSVAVIPESSSVSGVVSAFGQQSVANKTVDSFASTIKVSNRQVPSDEGQDDDENNSRNKDSSRMTLDLRAAAVSGSRKIKKTKAWKKLTSIVNSGGSTNNKDTAKGDDGDDLSDIFSMGEGRGTSTTKQAYSLRRRAQSEDNNTIRKNRGDDSDNNRNSIIGWGVKSISWEPGIWKNRTASSSSGEDNIGKNNSSKRLGGNPKQKQMEKQRLVRSQQNMTDRAIRGRLDGVDILSLGPACRSSLPNLPTNGNKKSRPKRVSTLTPNLLRKESGHDLVGGNGTDNSQQNSKLTLDPLTVLFTDIPTVVEPSDLVSDMVCMSAGQEHTEIVLEGFFPGGSDRWTVRLDNVSSSRSTGSSSHRSHPTLKTASMTDDESMAISVESSTNIPSNQLWDQLWGGEASPPPTPYHMKGKDDVFVLRSSTDSSIDDEELQHKFAADCNVPVDLDDDAFIVESPEQMYAVHQATILPIQARRFETAIGLFQKLLRGLEGAEETSDKKQWMIGATYHNIGMMHLCQAHFSDALHNFQNAATIRKACLPSNHSDIAVSLGRLGMVYFALNRITDARESFEEALGICRIEDATRAKILCNLGAAHYQLEDYGRAILVFTRALEIQRQWLDGPVRRETLVYDASVTLSNLGKCYQRKGDCDLAYFVYEEAWLLQTSHFRQDHDIVLASQDNMARVQATNGNYAEALRILSSLAKTEEARFGTNSELYIETIGMKGLAHYRLLELEEAESCLMEVSSWQSKHLWWSHPSIENTKELLKQVNRCLKGDDPMWL